MSSKCKRATPWIALSVGNDLDEDSQQDVRQHLAQCPRCRAYWQRMQSSLHILQEAEQAGAYLPEGSLWQDVATQLTTRKERNRTRRFNTQVGLFAVAATCLALVTIARRVPPLADSPDQPSAWQVPPELLHAPVNRPSTPVISPLSRNENVPREESFPDPLGEELSQQDGRQAFQQQDVPAKRSRFPQQEPQQSSADY